MKGRILSKLLELAMILYAKITGRPFTIDDDGPPQS